MTPSPVASSPAQAALPGYSVAAPYSGPQAPHGFEEYPVPEADLQSLFEAARWAATSYHEQPWSFIVATQAEPAEFARLLRCLAPSHQAWAAIAPVLILGIVRQSVSNAAPDHQTAFYHLGLTTASMTFEATARDVSVHPMIAIVPERARELYRIPEHSEASTALAIGYAWTSSETTPQARTVTVDRVPGPYPTAGLQRKTRTGAHARRCRSTAFPSGTEV